MGLEQDLRDKGICVSDEITFQLRYGGPIVKGKLLSIKGDTLMVAVKKDKVKKMLVIPFGSVNYFIRDVTDAEKSLAGDFFKCAKCIDGGTCSCDDDDSEGENDCDDNCDECSDGDTAGGLQFVFGT